MWHQLTLQAYKKVNKPRHCHFRFGWHSNDCFSELLCQGQGSPAQSEGRRGQLCEIQVAASVFSILRSLPLLRTEFAEKWRHHWWVKNHQKSLVTHSILTFFSCELDWRLCRGWSGAGPLGIVVPRNHRSFQPKVSSTRAKFSKMPCIKFVSLTQFHKIKTSAPAKVQVLSYLLKRSEENLVRFNAPFHVVKCISWSKF